MAIRSILTPYDVGTSEVPSEIYGDMRDFFFNEYPLVTRLPRMAAQANSFNILGRTVRDRSLTVLGGGLTNNTVTSLTLSSVGELLIGDVLELDTGERVEVASAINTTANTATVIRGAEGTTAATTNNNTTAYLLYNSRTGAEVDQEAARSDRVVTTQYIHTFQHPVQVGGRTAALNQVSTMPGASNAYEQQVVESQEELWRDEETACLYGKGQAAVSSSGRWKMKGLRALCPEANLTTSPTDAATYLPENLIADTIQKLATAGGRGDMLIVGPAWMSIFATWGFAAQRVEAGQNRFGVPIDMFEVPFLGGGISIMVDLAMGAGIGSTKDAVLINSNKVRIRFLRNESYKARGSRGDAFEGDWLSDIAIDVSDPARSIAWMDGSTIVASRDGT